MNLEKTYRVWLFLSAAVMLGLPVVCNLFVPWYHGVSANMLLYWVVFPAYSVIVGAYAGKEPGRLWGLPVLSSVLAVAGAAIRMARTDEPFFYGGICLALGLGVMWFRAL